MENETTEYDGAPQQRTRNTISVSGFSWAEVTAHTPLTPASNGPRSHVSEITTPTTVHQNTELTELCRNVDGLTAQVENLVKLLTLQASAAAAVTAQAQNQAHGYGYTHGPPPPHTHMPPHPHMPPQYMHPHSWQGPQFPMPPMLPPRPNGSSTHETPTRNNLHGRREVGKTNAAAKTTGLSPNKRSQQEALETHAAKRTDDKVTPTKMGPIDQSTNKNEQRMVNPYTHERQLQFRHAGTTPQYTPQNFVNHTGFQSQPLEPPNHDRRLYSPQYQFPHQTYSPPRTAECLYSNDMMRIENQPQSHSAEDAAYDASL